MSNATVKTIGIHQTALKLLKQNLMGPFFHDDRSLGDQEENVNFCVDLPSPSPNAASNAVRVNDMLSLLFLFSSD